MSIFNERNKMSHDYFKFDTIGATVEGTLIEKRVVENTLKNNEPQNVYTLLKEDGDVIDVYGKPGIDGQMKAVSLGQLVGFKFSGTKPAKTPGWSDTKLIDVYSDKKMVNKKWLEENKDWLEEEKLLKETNKETPVTNTNPNTDTKEVNTNNVSFYSGTSTANLGPINDIKEEEKSEVSADLFPSTNDNTPTQEEIIAEINKIAVDKLQATSAEEAKTKVMEKTGLAFIPGNLNAILEQLKSL